MAVEVQEERYLFKFDGLTKRNSRGKIPFIYNPLHDMEAILWIGTYFVSNKDVECVMKDGLGNLPTNLIEASDTRATRLTSQVTLSESLFYTRALRQHLIRVMDVFLEQTNTLHPGVRPFWFNLEDMRSKLVIEYRKAEQMGDPITCSVAQGLHKEFCHDLATGVSFLRAWLRQEQCLIPD